jgi:hypothetical protein
MAKINLLGVLGQIRKSDGALNNGGLVEVYVAGTSFSTPYISFKDSALTTNNTHPVVLDSSGYADIWVQGDVDVIVKESSGTTIRSKLGANPEQASGSSLLGTPNNWTALQTFSAGLTVPVGQTATMSGTIAGDTALTGIKTYDGLQRFDIGATFTVVSTGATVDLETATGNTINITGNAVAATVVSFNNSAREGLAFDVLFSISSGDLTLIHGANLNLPTSANITVAAGDRCRLVKTSTTTWTVMEYQRFNGSSLVILDNSITTIKIADSNVTTTKIADANVTLAKMATASVNTPQLINTCVTQSKLNTSLQQNTGTVLQQENATITYTGGEYSLMAGFSSTSAIGDFILAPRTTSGYLMGISFYNSSAITRTYFFQVRYLNATAPYNLGDGDIPLFVYAEVKPDGTIVRVDVADAPPWYYNGPNRYDPRKVIERNGKKYMRIRTLLAEHGSPREALKAKIPLSQVLNRLQTDAIEEVEITHAIKNRDMSLIPSPFVAKMDPANTIVLLDPVSPLIEKLSMLHDSPDDLTVTELLMGGDIVIGNTPLVRNTPSGVITVSARLK